MFRIIQQHDERDCGAACLAMLAGHYGLKHPLSKYRELTRTDRNGVNLYGLCDAARALGFRAEALSGDLQELLSGIEGGEIPLPFIAHTVTEEHMQHFVVVYAVKGGRFRVADPAGGRVCWSREEFAKRWTGYIVTAEKTPRFQKGNDRSGGLFRFFSLLKGQYGRLAGVAGFSLVISLVGMVGAFAFELVVDAVYGAESCGETHGGLTERPAGLHWFFLCLIGLYLLQAVLRFLRGWLVGLVSQKMDLRLMLPYYDRILDLPMASVNGRNTGEYLSRFSDAAAVREAVSGATLTLLLDSVMAVGCGVLLFLENPRLFALSLAVILLYALAVLCYRKPLEAANRAVMEHNGRVQSYLKESIDGVETLKTHRAESATKKKNERNFRRLSGAVLKNGLLSVSQDALCDLVELVGGVLLLWLSFQMVLANTVSVGSLITFCALLAYFTEPIKNLIGLQPLVQTAVVAAERLNDILEASPEPQGAAEPPACGEIAFRNVNFRYGNHGLILKDLSLTLKKGERVAIVGESGCGKTTLAKLLLKFYEAESGSITVDGRPLSDLSPASVRESVAYVDQAPFLFSDTVRNNLLLGNENATEEELMVACRAAKAEEFIRELPFGLETYLEENGKNLSGGQRQRLAIARALLRNPKVLLLDEATGNLDPGTEAAVRDTVFGLDRAMTCVIIAHRLSTVRHCDRILVMEKGTVVESGTHGELMRRKGKYYELYTKQ